MQSSPLWADIIFIDLNNNPAEVSATRMAALKRGEKVIVLGSDPEAVKHKQIERQVDRILDRLHDEKVRLNQPERDQLRSDLKNLTAILKARPDYIGKTLESDLGKIASSGTRISSLVISGHDGNGNFTGSNGSLSSQDVRDAFKGHAPLAEGLRSVILAGCYTGTLGSLDGNWKGIGPNIALLAGYDLQAPLGNAVAGHQYISEVLTKEPSLLAARDKKELERIFGQLRNIRLLNASICSKDLLVNKDGARSVEEIRQQCLPLKSDGRIDKWNDIINCYASGAKGCEHPPANSSNNVLRRVYNEVQSVSHCKEYLKEMKVSLPSPDKLIRLILYDNVAKNASVLHEMEIAGINSTLADSGIQKVDRLENIEGLSRAGLNRRFEIAEKAISNLISNPVAMSGPVASEIIKKRKHLFGLRSTLLELKPRCSPFSWVEPNATEKSPCFSDPSPEDIKNQVDEAYEAAVVERATEIFVNEKKRVSEIVDKLADIRKKTSNPNLPREERERLREERKKLFRDRWDAERVLKRVSAQAVIDYARKEKERLSANVPSFSGSQIEKQLNHLIESALREKQNPNDEPQVREID
jgi:hypothetical protein